MKNKIWQTIKTKRFLYALLYAVLLLAYMTGSSAFFNWLIPWRGLEVLIWFICFAIVLFKSGIAYANFLERHGI